MIRISTNQKGKAVFTDDQNEPSLSDSELAMVKAALSAGLTAFTIPTPADDQKRVDWGTYTLVVNRDGKPAAFTVAYQLLNAHFEILGPELPLGTPVLQKR